MRVVLGGDPGGGLLAQAHVLAQGGQVGVAGLDLESGALRPSAAKCLRAEWGNWCRVRPLRCGSCLFVACLNLCDREYAILCHTGGFEVCLQRTVHRLGGGSNEVIDQEQGLIALSADLGPRRWDAWAPHRTGISVS